MKSEFGKGLCYSLGLFLCHADKFKAERNFRRDKELEKKFPNHCAESWFNGASDHLYEIQWEQAPKHLQKRIKKFSDKCLNWGHGFPREKCTDKDVIEAIQEAKDLLRLIDKANGIKTIRGNWE